MMRVSVLMPTLNVQRYLADALQSVADSELATRGAIEVVLLDGGSTDETLAIAGRFAPLVRISQQRDRGMYDALNRGLTLAQGDLIAWLNGDDLFTPDGLSRLVEELDANPVIDAAYGNLALRDERDGVQVTQVRHADHALALLREGELQKGWVTPLCCLWRKASLQKIGGWSADWRAVGDLELWLRAAAIGCHAEHVETVVGTFRAHAGSLTSGGRHSRRVLDEDLRLCRDLLARSLPPPMRKAIEARRHLDLRWLVWSALKAREPHAALQAVRTHGVGEHLIGLVIEQLRDAVQRRLHPTG